VLNKLCDIVPEILIGLSIDVVVNRSQSFVAKAGIIDPQHQLYIVGLATALLWIGESVFEYWYSLAWRQLSQEAQHQLRVRTYDRIQHADLAYLDSVAGGTLLSVVQEDVNQLEQFLTQGPNEVIQLTVNVVFMGTLFFYLAPLLAILTLLPIPFIIGIAYYYQQRLSHAYASVRMASENLMSHIAYRLQGLTTIKSYTAEEYECARLTQESIVYTNASLCAGRIHAQYIPLVRMAIMAGFIMALVYGGVCALQGSIPINWYAALVFLTQRFLWPFTSLTSITDLYERSWVSAQRVLSVLQVQQTITNEEVSAVVSSSSSLEGAVAFRAVSFGYCQSKKAILHDFSLDIPAKKTVAFVGLTGSGKSTIVKLLLRFYDVLQGDITFDGKSLKTIPLGHLRQLIGYVNQEGYLVEGSIADNIAYGSFNASQEEIQKAAVSAQAHEFISRLPAGYATVLAEQGKNFSGGQRQRILIARALLRQPQLLILDEATSAVDNETEEAINKSLANMRHERTIVIIAHRLSAVRHADIIYVLDKGMIIEQGVHADLLALGGLYNRLWRIQSGSLSV
jgi:ATP-binding cassette subfamily B protein